jgi:negative regulator of sigma E activity
MDNQFPEQHEKLWRRPLPPSERAALRAQPELELEASLTDALARLPNAPVPSNFTARVMDAIDLEDLKSTRSSGRRWNWHALLPRFAVATAVLLFVGLGLQQHGASQRRADIVRTLSAVANTTASVPSLDALENLDAIRRMGQSAPADTELLAALQ